MKKTTILLTLLALFASQGMAQNVFETENMYETENERQLPKAFLGVAYKFSSVVDSWDGHKQLDKGLGKLRGDFAVDLNIMVYKNWGLWMEGSFGRTYNARMNDYMENLDRTNINKQDYYTIDHEIYEKGASGKAKIGILYRHPLGSKWQFMYRLGIGGEWSDAQDTRLTMKKKGSNEAYEVRYLWTKNSDYTTRNSLLVGEAMAIYPLYERLELNLGLNMRHYLNDEHFRYQIYDRYNGTPIDTQEFSRNPLNTIGLRIGISIKH